MNKIEIENLKTSLLTADWDEGLKIADKLAEVANEDVIKFLIKLLKSESADRRNLGAHSLREIKSDLAIEPLIEGVLYPLDPNKRGTLAYALETHNCGSYFIDIFKILFYGNYECKLFAHNILTEQKFLFDNDDLLHIKKLWAECIENPKLCPAFEDSKDEIQADVDSFLCYLEENE